MARMSKLSGLILVFAFLAGCNEPEKKPDTLSLLSPEQRQAYLEAQIQKKYENPQAHFELGRIYHAQGRWLLAKAAYSAAVEFDPMLWQAEAAIVKLYIDAGDTQKADLAAQAAMKRASLSPQMICDLAKAFQDEYLDDYALQCHSQALTIAPDSPLVYKQIGLYYLNKRDLANAETNLRHSFELDPYQPEVAGELGRMGVIVEVPGIDVKPKPPVEEEEMKSGTEPI